MSTPDAVIVVPCFDEADRLPVERFAAFLAAHPDVGFRFVNDGSRDATAGVLADLCRDRPGAASLDLAENRGKAEAVRAGVQAVLADGAPRLLGYWDADLATPLDEIPRFQTVLEEGRADLAMGSRIKRLGSEIERRAARHYFGRVFATAASLTLGLPVYDTQCGAKLMTRELAEVAFREPFVSGWLFDVEILARIKRDLGAGEVIQRVYEVPLTTWRDVPGSRVKLRDFAKAPLELLKIQRRYAG